MPLSYFGARPVAPKSNATTRPSSEIDTPRSTKPNAGCWPPALDTLTRVTVTEVTGRGRHVRTHVPVLVIGEKSWRRVGLGATVTATGRLARPDSPDLAGVLSTGRPPRVLTAPDELLAGAARVRAGIRASVAGAPPAARALVPAHVGGAAGGG